jgi:hypothetical protein
MSGGDSNIVTPLSSDELARMNAWWRAANYYCLRLGAGSGTDLLV